MKNELYQELRDYVKDNHGFGSELYKTELYKKYLKAKEDLRIFDSKKIKLIYSAQSDFIASSGIKFGKLVFYKKEDGTEQVRFYEGQNRSRYNILDLGLYEGFYAVLIIKGIEEATKEELKIEKERKKEEKRKSRYGF